MEDVLGGAQFVIDPPEYVTFQIDSAGPKEALLTLTNTSDNTLAYKVRRPLGLLSLLRAVSLSAVVVVPGGTSRC
jgi:hypothetical protein